MEGQSLGDCLPSLGPAFLPQFNLAASEEQRQNRGLQVLCSVLQPAPALGGQACPEAMVMKRSLPQLRPVKAPGALSGLSSHLSKGKQGMERSSWRCQALVCCCLSPHTQCEQREEAGLCQLHGSLRRALHEASRGGSHKTAPDSSQKHTWV